MRMLKVYTVSNTIDKTLDKVLWEDKTTSSSFTSFSRYKAHIKVDEALNKVRSEYKGEIEERNIARELMHNLIRENRIDYERYNFVDHTLFVEVVDKLEETCKYCDGLGIV